MAIAYALMLDESRDAAPPFLAVTSTSDAQSPRTQDIAASRARRCGLTMILFRRAALFQRNDFIAQRAPSHLAAWA